MNTKEQIKKELVELVNKAGKIITKLQEKDKDYALHHDYQAWYTKALKAVERLAPDRYEEFRRYYEPDPKRKEFGYGTYVIQDYLKGVAPARIPSFDTHQQVTQCIYNQYTILASLVARIDSVLMDIESGLFAELQDAELETAKKLIKVSPHAAGALAGVVLEGYLQKIAANHKIKITKKSPTLGEINDPLKNGGIYDTPTWRKIGYFADIRNLCSHKKTADPTVEQVQELIDGVNWVIKNVF